MPDSISLTPEEELCLQIENVIFRLLIHKTKINDKPDVSQEMLYKTMHSHISSECFVCLRGEITLMIPGGSIVMRPGDAVIVPPGIKHYKSKADILPGTVGYTVDFLCHKRNTREGADLYKQLYPFISGNQIIVFKNRMQICESVERIINESAESKLLPTIHMVELLIKAGDIPYQKIEPIANESGAELQGNDIQRMMKLDQLINVFFMHDLNVEEVASQLYISSRQLERIVKKRYGRTLRTVIIDKRIDTATEMLLSTDMTVDKIGVAIGFDSKSGFYREFSKRHGLTPAEYRKNNKKD